MTESPFSVTADFFPWHGSVVEDLAGENGVVERGHPLVPTVAAVPRGVHWLERWIAFLY
jgi:hypothetical protein